MKGVVFTTFLEYVEEQFGLSVVDKMVSEPTLSTKGAYTAVGTYPHTELLDMVSVLSRHVGTTASELTRLFGHHMFGVLARAYPALVDGASTSIVLMGSVEEHIHVEVRKLYSGAELPRFTTESSDADTVSLLYESPRGMPSFAEGLIQGCLEHFGDAGSVATEDLSGGAGTRVRFVVQRGRER